MNKNFRLIGSLAEATFNDESRTVKVTVIRQGWSHNGFFYGEGKPLESISNFLNTTAKQNYIDHNPKKEPFAPRKVQDWVSNVVRAWTEKDDTGKQSVKAEIKLFKSGPNAWIYERMKEDPNSFGPSIVGKAAIRKGTAEGQSGSIVEDITYLHSFDFVAQPSAGGSIDKVYETILFTEGGDVDDKEGILGDKLKEKLDKNKTREKLWDLEYMFNDLVRDLVNAEGDFEFDSIDDRKKSLSDLLSELSSQVIKLKFAPPKEKEGKQLAKEGDGEPMEFKTLADLKSQNRPLYDSLINEVITEQSDQEKFTKLKEDSDSLEKVRTELKEAKDSVLKLEQEKVDAEKKLQKVTEEKDKLEGQIKVAEAKSIIQKVKSEVKLTEEDCSELFDAELNEIAFEDAETYEQKIKAKCDDRKTLLSKRTPASPVKGMGLSVEQKTNQQESKFPEKSEDLANELKV